MQAIVLDNSLGRETSDVRGNLCADAEALEHCLQSARWSFRERKLRSVGHPHREEIRADHAFCSLDDKPVLQRPDIPGYLDVRGSALASRCDAPLVI